MGIMSTSCCTYALSHTSGKENAVALEANLPAMLSIHD
jgi:hypothetical protein